MEQGKSAKQVESERIDKLLANKQALIKQLQKQVAAIEKAGDWNAIQTTRQNLGNAQTELQFWQDYKNRNAVLWEPEPEPEPEPEQPAETGAISVRQLYQAAAARGYISQEEALGGMTGKIPQKISDMLDKLPAEDAFKAKMLLLSADLISYNNPLTDLVGQSMGLDREAQKAFFDEAAKL